MNPLVWSNFSTARMRPRLPSWIRSRKARPRLRYRLAMETTSRRLASMRASLASWPPRTSLRSAARWAVDSLATPASAASSRRAASLPATILSASSTSSAASSNFTLPISLRYMCTGSAADPRKPSPSLNPSPPAARRGGRSFFGRVGPSFGGVGRAATRPASGATVAPGPRRAGARVGSSATIRAGGGPSARSGNSSRSRPDRSAAAAPVIGTIVVSPVS